MKTFKNKNFVKRNYECTNVIFCIGKEAPNDNWVETEESIPKNMQSLWTENGVQFYGHM